MFDELIIEINKAFIKNNKLQTGSFKNKKHKELIDRIKEETLFLNNVSFGERIWYVFNKTNIPITCQFGNPVKFLGFSKGVSEYCDVKLCKCRNIISYKTKQTNLKKYGHECSLHSAQNKINVKKKIFDKFGVENISQSDIIKEKKKQTVLKNFGVEHPFQSKDVLEKSKQTCLAKYNVEHPSQLKETQDKKKTTNLERYGVENVVHNNDVKEKIKQTNNEKYGCEYPWQNKEIKAKVEFSNIERFGTKFPTQNDSVLEKTKQTNLERYGVDNPFKSEIIKDKIKLTNIKIYGVNSVLQKHLVSIFNDFHNIDLWNSFTNYHDVFLYFRLASYSTINRLMKLHRPDLLNPTISKPHQIIVDYLKSNNLVFQENIRSIINPLELDLYIPSKKFAIEVNGIYWHSEKQGKIKKYHLNKLEKCEELGIKLLQFTDQEILNKTDLVLSMIGNSLGITENKLMARKLKFGVVNNKHAKEFFENNHIQGHKNSSYYFGLFYDTVLISCISISKPRYSKGYNYEVIRFANKTGYSVVGAFSKLLKNSNLNGKFVSYANRMISNGNLYEKCGWKLENISSPCYWYTKDYKSLEHRSKYMKHKLEKLLKDYNPDLTEVQNMINNGYDRYWDCGTKVYSIELR